VHVEADVAGGQLPQMPRAIRLWLRHVGDTTTPAPLCRRGAAARLPQVRSAAREVAYARHLADRQRLELAVLAVVSASGALGSGPGTVSIVVSVHRMAGWARGRSARVAPLSPSLWLCVHRDVKHVTLVACLSHLAYDHNDPRGLNLLRRILLCARLEIAGVLVARLGKWSWVEPALPPHEATRQAYHCMLANATGYTGTRRQSAGLERAGRAPSPPSGRQRQPGAGASSALKVLLLLVHVRTRLARLDGRTCRSSRRTSMAAATVSLVFTIPRVRSGLLCQDSARRGLSVLHPLCRRSASDCRHESACVNRQRRRPAGAAVPALVRGCRTSTAGLKGRARGKQRPGSFVDGGGEGRMQDGR
jgi:hypothetical protein